MSSNLIKYGYNYMPNETTRVIDNNDIINKRLGNVIEKQTKADEPADGFVSGIMAPEIQVLEEIERVEEENPVPIVPEEIGPTKEEIIAEANAEIEFMRQQARAELEQEKLKVLESAKAQGYEEGVVKGKEDYKKKLDQLAKKEIELEALYNQQIEQLEPQLIELFNGIYEHVFTVDLVESQGVIGHLIKTAFMKIEGGNHYIVHISEEDYATVMEQKDSIVSKNNSAVLVEFVEDSLLKKNECMIETENGIFDCGIGTQLEELKKKLKLLSYQKA